MENEWTRLWLFGRLRMSKRPGENASATACYLPAGSPTELHRGSMCRRIVSSASFTETCCERCWEQRRELKRQEVFVIGVRKRKAAATCSYAGVTKGMRIFCWITWPPELLLILARINSKVCFCIGIQWHSLCCLSQEYLLSVLYATHRIIKNWSE